LELNTIPLLLRAITLQIDQAANTDLILMLFLVIWTTLVLYRSITKADAGKIIDNSQELEDTAKRGTGKK
jgi:hypothetical protein